MFGANWAKTKQNPSLYFLSKTQQQTCTTDRNVDDCAVAGEPNDVSWFKQEVRNFFTIKELGPIKKHRGVWYNWGVDKHGRYLQSNMEDFFEQMIDDFKELFGHYPEPSTIPALPSTSLCKNDSKTILHGEYREMLVRFYTSFGKYHRYAPTHVVICRNTWRIPALPIGRQ